MGKARVPAQGVPVQKGASSVFYSKEDLADMFGVCVRTIEKWTATGQLPRPRKKGRKWTMWPKAEIDLLLETWGKW